MVSNSHFFILSILTGLIAYFLQNYIPPELAERVGSGAVDNILNIVATSMLVVTTFSLSIMVSAYSSASTTATPRATKLLFEDQTTQNALSVFIGSFVFSLVGIVTLKIGIYSGSGKLVLLVVTLGVILSIIIMLVRWIDYLSHLGRLSETVQKIELTTRKAFLEKLKNPTMGCHKLLDSMVMDNLIPIRHQTVGYLQNIDVKKLSEIAQEHDLNFYIPVLPGHFNDSFQTLAYITKSIEKDLLEKIQSTFSIDHDRTFEQDPRYGCVVLNEIAIRALSPAVNDQGTAISIIDTLVQLLITWITYEPEPCEIQHPQIYLPEISMKQLLDDSFYTIAREGAEKVEIAIRLQQAFKSLAGLGNPECRALVQECADLAYKRSQSAMQTEEDLIKLKEHLLKT